MTFSTITIHMATVDGANFMQALDNETDECATFKETLFEYINQAPFNIPTILFKTGTLAIIFSTLKYGGITHGIALVLLPWIVGNTIWAVRRDHFDCDDFKTSLLGFVFLCVNTFTTFMPKIALAQFDDYLPFGGAVGCFRIYTWVGYALNVAELAVCYILTEMERKDTIEMITFHCETNDWMRANLHIVCIGLASLGLLSCILTEIFLLRNVSRKVDGTQSEGVEMENLKTDE